MQSKEEERAVLLKIEKALSAAEPDGWVATAFEGCVALAHSNIDNDAMDSPLFWSAKLARKSEDLKKAEQKIKLLNLDIKALKDDIAQKSEQLAEMHECYKKVETVSDNQSAEIIFLKDEIVRLKAKLYDMIEGTC